MVGRIAWRGTAQSETRRRDSAARRGASTGPSRPVRWRPGWSGGGRIVDGGVSRPDGWPDRMARHGAERDTAQGLSGAEGREHGPVPTGQMETGVVWGRENRGRRREPAGWLAESHGEARRRARHGAGTQRRGGARARARPDRSDGDRGGLGEGESWTAA